MKQKSGKEAHIIVNTLNIVQLLNKTLERFETKPSSIPAIFGQPVEKSQFQFGSICAAFYMLFVLCRDNGYYEQETISAIDGILSKATVIEALREGPVPKLRNLRNAIAHGNIEPLGNNEFSFINEGENDKKEPYKLVFTIKAQDLIEIMNIALKDLNLRINK